MSQVTISPITSGYNLAKINSNFVVLSTWVNNNSLATFGGNNVMNQDLDMNNFTLLNAGVLNVHGLTIDGVPVSVINLGSLGPNSVGSAQIIDGSVTSSKLASGIDGNKINFIQDGSGAVTRTSQDKGKDIVSVKDFGAKGDGTTDDTVSIQVADAAATALGKTLYFPAGTYMVRPGQISLGGSSWRGAGMFKSVLKVTATSFTSFQAILFCQNKSYFTIEDLGFDMSNGIFASGTTYSAIALVTCNHWFIRRVSVEGIKEYTLGVAVNGGNHWGVEESWFHMPVPTANQAQAVNVSTSAGSVLPYAIKDNMCLGCAIYTDGADGTISGNMIKDWKFGSGITTGLGTIGCQRNKIVNNYCAGSTGIDSNAFYPAGIEIWSNHSIVEGNTCISNSGHGIQFGAPGIIVRGNVCLNNGQTLGPTQSAGIYGNSTTGLDLVNCIVSNNISMDTQLTKTQGYGYREANVGGTLAYNAILGNNFDQNATGTVSMVGISNGWQGPKLYQATTWNPGVVANGSTSGIGVTVQGARLGDSVKVGYGAGWQNCIITGFVDANDHVTVVLYNCTAISRTFTSAPLNIWVEKNAAYASVT